MGKGAPLQYVRASEYLARRAHAQVHTAHTLQTFSGIVAGRVGTARELGQWRSHDMGAVAVGMLIAEHPPHRSGRAAFPHTAPTSDV